MLANCPRQFQLSLAVLELVWYSSCYLHVTIRHKVEETLTSVFKQVERLLSKLEM